MSDPGLTTDTAKARTRTAIVDAAAHLLRTGGADAVTTRAVAAEAGVQAPTIFRIFGDKDGLLDAVAEHVMATYVAGKAKSAFDGDPVADLRAGWAQHIDFCLTNPALFMLLMDPRRGARSAANADGREVLRSRVRRVAAAGRLRVAEHRAVELLQATGTGVLLMLVPRPPDQRDLSLADTAYAAVSREILTDTPVAPAGDTTAAAVALRSAVPTLDVLSAAEAALFTEWLDRIADR